MTGSDADIYAVDIYTGLKKS